MAEIDCTIHVVLSFSLQVCLKVLFIIQKIGNQRKSRHITFVFLLTNEWKYLCFFTVNISTKIPWIATWQFINENIFKNGVIVDQNCIIEIFTNILVFSTNKFKKIREFFLEFIFLYSWVFFHFSYISCAVQLPQNKILVAFLVR